MHEHVARGTAAEIKVKLDPTMPRGEFVVVIKGVGWRHRTAPSLDAPEPR
jgi:hypothetical protein